jgi:arylsulfatase A-like enzyme
VHYDCSSKVPLIIRGPTIQEKQTRSQIVNNLDVTATILDWSGAKPGLPQEGKSLTPVISSASAPWRSALLIEALDPQLDPERRYKALRTEKFKYVRYDSGFEELYDLPVDPWELENKASNQNYASDLAKLRIMLCRLKNCSGADCWAD